MATNKAYILVGGSGTGSIRRWDGVSWTEPVSPTSNELRCVHGFRNKIYAGGDSGTIICSTDGGVTWSNMTTPSSGWDVNGIWVIAQDDVWAALDDGAGSGAAWHYDGVSWSVSTTSGQGGWWSICATTDGTIYAGSDEFGVTETIWSYNGSTWTSESTAPGYGQAVGIYPNGNNVTFHLGAGSDEIWAGTSGSFSLQHNPSNTLNNDGQNGNNVWIDSTGKTYVVGGRLGGTYGGKIGMAYYNGSTWSDYNGSVELPDIGTALVSIHGIDDEDIVACEEDGSGGQIIYWDGSTWQAETVQNSDNARGVYGYIVDATPPFIADRDPAPGETDVPITEEIGFSVNDAGTGVVLSTVNVYVTEGSSPEELVYNGSSFSAGWTSSSVVGTISSYIFNLVKDTQWTSNAIITMRVVAEDLYENSSNTSWTFQIFFVPFTDSSSSLVHEVNVNIVGTVLDTIRPIKFPNQFDEHGSLLSTERLSEEKNSSYKRRVLDAAVNQANSSYRGLINGITRELGLSLYDAIYINPKIDSNRNFLAPDPYILLNDSQLLLYSDFQNNVLDWLIDRIQPGGNYEHLGDLVDFINTTYFFEASFLPGVQSFTKSSVLLNQSNRKKVQFELIPQSTKFKLKNSYISKGTIFFSNRNTFRQEVSSSSAVISVGQFSIDYNKGIITVFSIPQPNEHVRYSYTDYLFKAKASPVILHNINSDSFKTKLFEQVNNLNGIPTELGTDIINELLSVIPMYWGV